MTTQQTPTEQFRAARDQLLASREDIVVARQVFEWPHFENFNFAIDWFDAVAATDQRAEQNALVIREPDGSSLRMTYRQLSDRSSAVANWMRDAGVQRGDRMLVMFENRAELWETMLAGIKLGVVLMPTTVMLNPADLQERIQRTAASWVVTDAHNATKLADVPEDFEVLYTPAADQSDLTMDIGHPVRAYAESYAASTSFAPDAPSPAHDPILWYFTSGTTSQAKLVEHSNVSYPVGHLSTVFWLGLQPGDIHLNIASAGWAKHAWSNFFAPFIAEATVFVYNYDRFNAEAMMNTMDEESVTSLCAPPTVWRMMIQADLSTLKNPPSKVVAAGEPLNPKVINLVKQHWGVDIRDGYGQTETTLQIANTPGQHVKPGSVGRVLPGFDVVLIDEHTGEEIHGPGEGEVCLKLDPRPVGLFNGYRANNTTFDQAREAEAFHDGLYHTSDVMERDADGIFTYVGRVDDLFKSSDYKLSPFELESVVIEHQWVAEAAVVPSPDPLRLSVPKAFVTLKPGVEDTADTAEEILGFCRKNLPPYARIRRLEFFELPKTISGKIRRVELRAKETELHGENGELTVETDREFTDAQFPGLRR